MQAPKVYIQSMSHKIWNSKTITTVNVTYKDNTAQKLLSYCILDADTCSRNKKNNENSIITLTSYVFSLLLSQ